MYYTYYTTPLKLNTSTYVCIPCIVHIPCIIQERVVFTRNTYYSEALRVYSRSRITVHVYI